MSSPMRISSGFNWMSFSTVVSCCESERYFSTMPAAVSVPVISSVVRRRSVTKPLSFMIFSNCPTASMNLVTVSRSSISLGTSLPLQRVENVLS
jgi:lipoprotein